MDGWQDASLNRVLARVPGKPLLLYCHPTCLCMGALRRLSTHIPNEMRHRAMLRPKHM